jgi:polyferredoxin
MQSLIILLIIGSLIIYNLTFRPNLDLKIIPNRNPLFVLLSNGDIRNGYEIKIYNKSNEERNYSLKILDDKTQTYDQNSPANPNFKVKIENPINTDLNNVTVEDDSSQSIKIYVSINPNKLSDSNKHKIKFMLLDNKTKEVLLKESVFMTN